MGDLSWLGDLTPKLRSKSLSPGGGFFAAQTFSVPLDENLWTGVGQSTGFRERERKMAGFGLLGGQSVRTSSTGFQAKKADSCA